MNDPKPKRALTVIGWQEAVDLPDLGLTNMIAKIDTGARTSALHAEQISRFEKDGAQWVRFHTKFDDEARDVWIECPIHDLREIRNTSGQPEERIVIRTKFRIARRAWTIDVSLAERGEMQFRMIVGRSALSKHAIAVHTRARFLTQDPAKALDITGKAKT
ncbi:RimK/LysX family protein [Ascidiaceihabitans sp.]|uniref:ATP-dependent zinc protease family protein n=1 Tax=Ascidiaceihabitans sp. TaxID=1872644 RepID=UPI0032989C19